MRPGQIKTHLTAPLAIIAAATGLVYMVRQDRDQAVEMILAKHRLDSQREACTVAGRVDLVLHSMVDVLRVIARVPGVGDATNGRPSVETVRSIRSLSGGPEAAPFAELYITAIDSTTSTGNSIACESIAILGGPSSSYGWNFGEQADPIELPNSGARQAIAAHLEQLRELYPSRDAIRGQARVLVRRCEAARSVEQNSYTADTTPTNDLVMSVPTFAKDGSFSGCISAVIDAWVLRNLLPNGEYVLFADGRELIAIGRGEGPALQYAASVSRGGASRPFLCSESEHLTFGGGQAAWTLWHGKPDLAFYARPDVIAAERTAAIWYGGIAGLAFAGVLGSGAITNRILSARRRREELELKLEEQARELSEIAVSDKLTGLPNRVLIMDRIERAMARASRKREARYAVIFLDFDRFRAVNDTLGHETGDRLLIAISERLQGALRASDSVARADVSPSTAARLGGDEFVVLLEDLAALEDAEIVARRLIRVLEAPYEIDGEKIVSTTSIGIVRGDLRYERAWDLLRDADTAMSEAKAAGKGRYAVFNPAMRERVVRRAVIERDLGTAVERGELELYYQPVVRLVDGHMASVEALVRWRHATLGSVSPSEFIPIAEESNAIARLTDWVVTAACKQVVRWHETLGVDRTPRVAVNISRALLADEGLAEHLVALVRSCGVQPSSLCLEITETAIVRDQTMAIAAIQRLNDAGFKLALDDFGTGYSSLSTLHHFPLDVVKLDRSFIVAAAMSRESTALIHAVVSLAANLGMAVVAEGVETPEQVAMLQALECKFAQGFLFGRPMLADQIGELALGQRSAA